MTITHLANKFIRIMPIILSAQSEDIMKIMTGSPKLQDRALLL